MCLAARSCLCLQPRNQARSAFSPFEDCAEANEADSKTYTPDDNRRKHSLTVGETASKMSPSAGANHLV